MDMDEQSILDSFHAICDEIGPPECYFCESVMIPRYDHPFVYWDCPNQCEEEV